MSAWYRRRWILIPGALALVLALVLTVLLATPLGLRLGLAFAPPELRVGSSSGGLLTAFELRDVAFDSPAAELRLSRLRVDLAPAALLAGELRVRAIELGEVDVHLLPVDAPEAPTAETTPFEPPVVELPVAITLGSLSTESITIRSSAPSEQGPATTELLRLEAVSLEDVSFRDSLLALRELAVRHALGTLEAGAELRAAPPYDADLRLSGAWEDRLTAKVTIEGDESAYDVKVSSAGILDSRVDATVRDPLSDPVVRLDLAVEAASLAHFLEAPPVESAAIEIVGEANLRSAELVTHLTVPGFERLRLEKDIDFDPATGTVQVNRLELREVGAAGLLLAQGEVGLEPPFRTDLTVHWSDLSRIRLESVGLHSERGQITVRGPVEDLVADLALNFASDHGTGTVAGTLRHLPGILTIDQLAVDTLGGRIGLTGEVGYEAGVNARGALTIDTLDLGSLVGRPATLGLDSDFDLAIDEAGTPTGTLRIESIAGTLDGRPVSGGGLLALAGEDLNLDDFTLAVGDNRVAIDGRVGSEIDLEASVDGAALEQLLPGLAGTVTGRIQAEGPRATPRARVDLEGRAIAYRDSASGVLAIDRLDLDAELSLAPDAENTVELTVTGLTAADRVIDSIALTVDGTQAAHRGALTVDAAVSDLEFGWQGGLDGSAYAGMIESLTIAPAAYAPLKLEAPVPFEASEARAGLGAPLCLAGTGGELCLTGSREQAAPVAAGGAVAALAASLELDHLDLAQFGPLLDEAAGRPLGLAGELSGRAAFTAPTPEDWRAEIALEAPKLTVRLTTGAEPFIVGEQGMRIDAILAPDALDVDLAASLLPSGRIDAKINGDGLDPEDAVTGTVEIAAEDFSAFQPLLTGVAELRGAALVNATLGGTIGAPEVLVEAGVSDFGAEVPPLGLALTEGSVTVSVNEIGTGEIDAGIRSGEGRLTVNSQFAAAQRRAVLTVIGKDFVGMDSEQIRAVISPTLAVQVAPDALAINGTVAIPSLFVDLTALEGSVSSSPDVVVVGREEETGGLPMTLDVEVRLGDDIRLEGFGVNGQLAGTVRLTQQPGQATLCSGQVTVGGGLKAYGQDLQIRRGRLLFSGTPCEDPVLEIEAVRVIESISATAGVRVEGTASFPELTLFSNPAREESEVLCMLVTGKTCGSAGAGSGDAVGDALMQAGLSAGSSVTNKLGQQAGLDELSLTSSDEFEGAGVTVGKYIAEDVYVSYGRSFSNNVQFFETAYEITERLTVSVRQALETITALRYEIETD